LLPQSGHGKSVAGQRRDDDVETGTVDAVRGRIGQQGSSPLWVVMG